MCRPFMICLKREKKITYAKCVDIAWSCVCWRSHRKWLVINSYFYAEETFDPVINTFQYSQLLIRILTRTFQQVCVFVATVLTSGGWRVVGNLPSTFKCPHRKILDYIFINCIKVQFPSLNSIVHPPPSPHTQWNCRNPSRRKMSELIVAKVHVYALYHCTWHGLSQWLHSIRFNG